MWSRFALLPAAALVLVPASAPAQVTVTAAPGAAGAVSHLQVAIDGSAPAFGNRLPKGLVLSLDRGFAIDVDAATFCSDSAGGEGGCPPESQVAGGTAVVEASFAGAPGSDVSATVQVFRTQTAPSGTLAGLVVVVDAQGQRANSRGVLKQVSEGPLGYEVRFDDLAAPPAPVGVTLRFKRLDLDIGATRRDTVTKKRRVRCKSSSKSRACRKRPGCRRGRRCPRYRTVRRTTSVRRDLLRNPAACAGTWASRAVTTFQDGSSTTVEPAIACTP